MKKLLILAALSAIPVSAFGAAHSEMTLNDVERIVGALIREAEATSYGKQIPQDAPKVTTSDLYKALGVLQQTQHEFTGRKKTLTQRIVGTPYSERAYYTEDIPDSINIILNELEKRENSQ